MKFDIAIIDLDPLDNTWIDANGYLRYGKDLYLHRLLAERYFNVRLTKKNIVHHRDRDKLNNTEENLLICRDQKEHMIQHAKEDIQRAVGEPSIQMICGMCKKLKYKIEFNKDSTHWTGHDNDCRECKYAYKTRMSLNRRPEHLKWKDGLAQQYRRVKTNYTKREITWL